MVDTPIVSEALQKTFRDNFPRQVKSGRDLHVSDVVLPIVDFSTVAGVSGINETLQSALSFGNQTAFNIFSTTTTLANTPGFWRFFGTYSIGDGYNYTTDGFYISDGSTDKRIFGQDFSSYATPSINFCVTYDFVVFLTSGDSVKGTAGNKSNLLGSFRQLADISGTLVNPTGYTGE